MSKVVDETLADNAAASAAAGAETRQTIGISWTGVIAGLGIVMGLSGTLSAQADDLQREVNAFVSQLRTA